MKNVADSIKRMAASATMAQVLNRAVPVDDTLIQELIEHWSYDLYERRPGPALFENGVLKPTDLDLACFLSALVARRAVINLPQYKARRAATHRQGEHVLSKENRHGRVIGLTANREAFSFSIRIEDQNVITAGNETRGDSVGAPRNFMLLDVDGTWHEGWKAVEFMPSAKENAFLHDRGLWTDNTIVFKNFVHPNRWVSFYGHYYFLTKTLIARLEGENEFRREAQKRLVAAGIRFPLTGTGRETPQGPLTEKIGEDRPIKVRAFECEVDVPWFGAFPPLPSTQAALVENAARVKYVQYQALPQLRFAVRATELAFALYASEDMARFPAWIRGAKWDEGHVQKGKRKEWNRLVLAQLYPGQTGFALRYRKYEKTERVAG